MKKCFINIIIVFLTTIIMTTCLLQKGQIKIFTGIKNKIGTISKDSGADLTGVLGFTTNITSNITTINITNSPQQMNDGVINGNILDKITVTSGGFRDINGSATDLTKYQTNGVAVLGLCNTLFYKDTLLKFGIELNNIKHIIMGPQTTVTFGYYLLTKDGSITNRINDQIISFTSASSHAPKCIKGVTLAKGYMTLTHEDIIDKMITNTSYKNVCPNNGTKPAGCMINHPVPANSIPFINTITITYATQHEGFDNLDNYTINGSNNMIQPNNNNNKSLIFLYVLLFIIMLICILVLYDIPTKITNSIIKQ